ncbi:unnamed protein product [Cylindrotheca closterium]|uniref:Lipid droplet-associated hydrolase n=1 Tax=Cylindrotheca closterium TaxID=2856 RepID=A0AAD2PWW2_9STRA|nr:unnamed protein product [Cylindrotheca closterium]
MKAGTIRLPKVSEHVVDILGWPTDVISIDYDSTVSQSETNNADLNTTMPTTPHTTLVFIPGNPGCCAWYQPILLELIKALGLGYCARLVSYAGHNPYHPDHANVEKHQERLDASIVWTVDGQIRHKEAFVDQYCNSYSQLIFLSHSIGSHMVERLLMQRTDILQRTACVIHMMPFVRMKAPNQFDQAKLDFGAANPNLLIGFGRSTMKVLAKLYSTESLNALLENFQVYQDAKGRDLAAHLLLQQPHYARNFFELGTEEIRDVPFAMDRTCMKQITRHCPLILLYCANDQWAPYEHTPEILEESNNKNKNNKNNNNSNGTSFSYPISIHYFPNHKHDFVSVDAMVPPITNCCLQAIQQSLGGHGEGILRSRL